LSRKIAEKIDLEGLTALCQSWQGLIMKEIAANLSLSQHFLFAAIFERQTAY